MRRAAAACVLSLALAGQASAAETASFLRILPGARPMSLGEAYTAVADDLNALTTNPSGLSRIQAREAGFMHAELYSAVHYDFLGYSQPVAGGAGAIGFGVQRLAQGGLDGRDASGQTTGSFSAADTAVGAAGSFKLPDGRTLAGVGLKLVQSQLANASAQTFAVDAGLMRGLDVAPVPVTVGASVRNLGPGLRLGTQTEDLPLTVSVGLSARLAGALLISADASDRPHAATGGKAFSVGTEYSVLPTFALRAGYAPISASGGSPMTGFGFGFGLRVSRASIDYGFTPAGDLGAAQRLSLTFGF